MTTLIHRVLKDERGATSIEYAVIGAIISVAIVAAVTSIGGSLTGIFTNVNSDL
jgi:pilus assembly protein Flp/PilA